MARRTGLKIGLALAVILVLASVAGFFFVKPYARRVALELAHAHGVDLRLGELDYGIGWAKVTNAEFSLVDFPRIHGKIRQLDVTLDRLTPKAIRVVGMDVEAEGSAPTLVLGIVEWTGRFPHTYALPAEAAEVNVTWRQDPGGEPFARLTGGAVKRTGTSTSFHAEHALLGACPEKEDDKSKPCPDLGSLGAAWTSDDATVTLGFGEEDMTRAPVRIEVKPRLEHPTADITLAPVDVKQLSGPFGVSLPLKNVTVSGGVHLELGKDSAPGQIVTGHMNAKLAGFVPPHPRELDGFLFGDATFFESNLSVSETRERVDFTDTKVTAGSFKLAGAGSLEREGDHGHGKLELKGNLPCAALAGAAADSYLGRTLGGIAGELAKQLVTGSVGVTVKVDALTNDLQNAKVQPIIGIGCGLKPLKLPDLDPTKLGLPPLPSSLPSSFPTLPGLPPLDFPLGPPPSEKPKKDTKQQPK